MGVISKIIDGYGSSNLAKVGAEGELSVVIHPHPPKNEEIEPLPFSQFFTDDGTSAGSADMIVDGSVNYVDFYVSASSTTDIYIKSLVVQISDSGAKLDKFGALTALTNGVKFLYQEVSIGELVISEAIKTNLNFFRDATGGKNFGSGTNSWLADISGGGQDTYFPELDLAERFGMTWGLRLVKGTTDKLIFRVQDNLAGMAVFDVKAFGLQI